jgi:hypothetical protein
LVTHEEREKSTVIKYEGGGIPASEIAKKKGIYLKIFTTENAV